MMEMSNIWEHKIAQNSWSLCYGMGIFVCLKYDIEVLIVLPADMGVVACHPVTTAEPHLQYILGLVQ